MNNGVNYKLPNQRKRNLTMPTFQYSVQIYKMSVQKPFRKMDKSGLIIQRPAGAYLIRPIGPDDSLFIRDIILETLIEHGAVGGGFASGDRDTQEMYSAFQRPGRKYFVVLKYDGLAGHPVGDPLGGAGFASLPGEEGTCELVKMYFRPEIRGVGIGKVLLELCLKEARKAGYHMMYLETIEQMTAARGLYEHLGFRQIPHALGKTGHYSCDVFYVRELEDVTHDP